MEGLLPLPLQGRAPREGGKGNQKVQLFAAARGMRDPQDDPSHVGPLPFSALLPLLNRSRPPSAAPQQ